jgi:hypothetical protein
VPHWRQARCESPWWRIRRHCCLGRKNPPAPLGRRGPLAEVVVSRSSTPRRQERGPARDRKPVFAGRPKHESATGPSDCFRVADGMPEACVPH